MGIVLWVLAARLRPSRNCGDKPLQASVLGGFFEALDMTYAMRKLKVVPVPTSTNIARSSFSARATRVNLSNFSLNSGTRSKKRARNIPVMDTKRAKPDNPAVDYESRSQRRVQ
jgi:hypothetical protein